MHGGGCVDGGHRQRWWEEGDDEEVGFLVDATEMLREVLCFVEGEGESTV